MFKKNASSPNVFVGNPISNWIPAFAGMTVMLALIYYPTGVWLYERWSAKDSYFGHGFLIPLVSLYWIYKKREELKSAAYEKAGFLSAAFFVSGMLLQLAASAFRIYFLSSLSFVLLLAGAVGILWGKRVLKIAAFPISFLLFMIPLPLLVISQMTLKLKFLVSEISVAMVQGMGINAVREGSYIFTPNAVLLVGDPCSGLRSFLAFFCLGIVFAYESRFAFWKKTLLVLSAFPLAIFSNILRVLFLVLVGEIYGMQYTKGFIHDASGFAVFAFSFVFFLLIRQRLEALRVH